MIPVLLIGFPLLTGIIAFFLCNAKLVKAWALSSSIITLAILLSNLSGLYKDNSFSIDWIPALGASFTVMLDGMGKILCLLTAAAFPIIFIATYKNEYKKPGSFYAWMLLSQAGLMGVFVAADVLLFYFFWELALIPAYFLCSQWGGEKRIQATFKFFIYTFAGSLLMLVGIIYLYLSMPNPSFSLQAFYSLKLSIVQQSWLFWLFFIAFAIKMPVFPFHTWQPDTYEQAPTAATMVLSGIMVKMGLFAVIRWLIPIFPQASHQYAPIVITLSIIGIIYASLIAMRQDNLKRLVAYSSIAHIGLMCAAIFAQNNIGLQGVMLQMFSHGINIIGLWIVIDAIECRTGTRQMSQLGGLATKAPALTILLIIVALANIALPLTNAFIGEFLMFNGLFQYNIIISAIAGIGIILSAVYTLNMIRKVFYGEENATIAKAIDINIYIKIALILIVLLILVFGIYAKPLLQLVR